MVSATSTRLAQRGYVQKPDPASIDRRVPFPVRLGDWSLGSIRVRHPQGPTPTASEALADAGGIGGHFASGYILPTLMAPTEDEPNRLFRVSLLRIEV